MSCPRDSLIEVGVVQDDVRALPAELECHVLQVALRRVLHDLPPDESRAGKRDLLNVHVFRDRLARGVPVAIDDVDGTRREASFDDEVRNAEGGERRELGWLEDDRVPCREGGAKLPREHQEGEIPGNNLAHDADRLVPRVRELRLGGLNALTHSASILSMTSKR